jgi:hypothetical protein
VRQSKLLAQVSLPLLLKSPMTPWRPPSWPHLTLITSPRLHFQVPLTYDLETRFQHMNLWRAHSHHGALWPPWLHPRSPCCFPQLPPPPSLGLLLKRCISGESLSLRDVFHSVHCQDNLWFRNLFFIMYLTCQPHLRV